VSIALDLDARSYVRNDLHGADRCWSETNCYVDLWIELLHALGLPPAAAGACALSTDFDGDQWSFFKYPPEDLRALFGLDVREMNIWRPLVVHVEEQLGMGRLLTVEVDAHFLPDTEGVTYHQSHAKTTIAPASLDRAAHRLGYFHSAGYFELEGTDFDGIFTPHEVAATLPPYVELIRLDALRRDQRTLAPVARALLRTHLARRPKDEPIRRLGQRIAQDIAILASEGDEYFHGYAFGTCRQCGAAAEVGASFVTWLDRATGAGIRHIAERLTAVATDAKALELMLARAARGRSVEVGGVVDGMARAWEDALAELEERYG
jgi:hypothetical protein